MQYYFIKLTGSVLPQVPRYRKTFHYPYIKFQQKHMLHLLTETVPTYQGYILIWMDQLTGCTGCCKSSRLTSYRCSWFSRSTVCCASGGGCRLRISRECWFWGLCGCCRCSIQRFEISTNWTWNSCLSL